MTVQRTCLILLLLCVPLVGCAPYPESYLRIDQPLSTYRGTDCRGSFGPPAIATFPHEGVFFVIRLYPPRIDGQVFAIQVPEGITAQLLDKSIQVEFDVENEKKTEVLQLKPNVWKNVDYFGPLVGHTYRRSTLFGENEWHEYYEFSFQADLTRAISGHITFPRISVKGREFPGFSVPFHRATYLGAMTFNC
jgi:hypothetical protein